MGETGNAYQILVGKSFEKQPRGRVSQSWEDNIMMDLGSVGCKVQRWMGLVQNHV